MNQSSCSEFMIIKKESKTKKTLSKDEIERQGRWNKEENMKYFLFLTYNQSKFECKKKRMFRLYKPLSQFIGTRNSQQCRSHHRKLLQRFKTPKSVISNMNQFFEKEQMEKMRIENQEKLQLLHIPQKKIKSQQRMQFEYRQGVEEKININNQKTSDQILDVTGSIGIGLCPSIEQSYGCSIYSPSTEVTMVDYQAYNWFSQMCLANYNYFCYTNYALSLDSNQYSLLNDKQN